MYIINQDRLILYWQRYYYIFKKNYDIKKDKELLSF